MRLASGSSAIRGECWPAIAPARFIAPGTTTRLPLSAPSTAARATKSTSVQNISGRLSSAPPTPATSTNSVFTGPGQSAVTVTPLPLSSAWVASLSDEHEGLGRGVGGGAGDRLKGGCRGDVDDRAAAALGHRRRVTRLQVEQRLAVERDHGDDALAVGLVKRCRVAEAGVVDQHLDVETEHVDGGGEPVALLGSAEVGGDRLDADAMLARDLRRQLAQAILAAGDQGEAVAAAGELARDLGSDPRGGARDQGRRGLRGRWQRHRR